jgi:hypothetical protein
MTRARISLMLVAGMLAMAGTTALADVRSEQRVKVQLGGAVGKLVNMFGGKAARDGVVSTVAVKGDRKATMSDSTGQIIDLAEEKVYDLDLRKKTYKVTTFAELRKRMEEARRDAEKGAREQAAEAGEPAPKDPDAKQMEVDFEVKNTGATQSINGFDTRQSVIKVTVREKGKTLEQSGGLVMTTDMWLTTTAPSTKELQDFDMRYAQAVYGPLVTGASAQDMATAMAMYPQMKPALDKMRAESNKIEGTPILTIVAVDAVKPAIEEAAAAKPADSPRPRGLGGMLGGITKKMAKKDDDGKPATIMTTSVELLKLTASVDAASVALPAGFSEQK